MWLAGSLNVYFLEFYKLAEDVSVLYKTANAANNTEILIFVESLLKCCLIGLHSWFFTKFITFFNPGQISAGLNYNHSLSL